MYKIINAPEKDCPLMVFLHGWPDNDTLWQHQIEYFKKNYHCAVFDYSQFATHTPNRLSVSLDDLENAIIEQISSILSDMNKKSFILVAHDWGAYLAYRVQDRLPKQTEKLVTLDVSGNVSSLNIFNMFKVTIYQWYLAFMYMIGDCTPRLSNYFTQALARIMRCPSRDLINTHSNYYYFSFWKNFFTGKWSKVFFDYRPDCPQLFIYAGVSPIKLHTQNWLEHTDKRNDSKVIKMPNHRHWFLLENPEQTNTWIEEWLQGK